MDHPSPLPAFRLGADGAVLTRRGTDVTVFEDFYPAGHQSGVTVVMHGERVAANGDLRFEPTPGQWQPVPKLLGRDTDPKALRITASLVFPDAEAHLKGFNPLVYPDCAMEYRVSVQADGPSVEVTVDLVRPPEEKWARKLCFNLELFPGLLFGKSWIMDGASGVFPRQPVGPVEQRPSLYRDGILPHPETGEENTRSLLETDSPYSPLRADEEIAVPYACGHRFTLCPEDDLLRMTVESGEGPLRLYDGRMNHNNGWFVLSSPLSFSSAHALRWRITPNAVPGWLSPPRIQLSQVGYLPAQPKIAVLETDPLDETEWVVSLHRIGPEGPQEVLRGKAVLWGRFLRYRCFTFDFSSVTEEGLYLLSCPGAKSNAFRIGEDVLDRGVWQPVLEYFLPIQMCHMRVFEKYRVWHGLCHTDDARMAPVNWQHFDGYRQGKDTLTRFPPGSRVPGLDRGGWHDAGDFDLRVESQSGEAGLLSLVFETFHLAWDTTTIDQETRTVEIHRPDGKNDLLQQIEHGLLSVLGPWRSMGRLYRGIIASRLRQYVLLGDPVNMTGARGDERWVFTGNDPAREWTAAAHLACISRALRDHSPALAEEALSAARSLYFSSVPEEEKASLARAHAAAELFLSTGEGAFADALLKARELFRTHPRQLGWIGARLFSSLGDASFTAALREGLAVWKQQEDALAAETPYGVPYRPHIWGAGWEIQRLGCEHYFLCRAFPDLFSPTLTFRALDFVLGCHPGKSVSFASGIGADSAVTAYGFNRADFSSIPGGVISGTALIRPDLPELKEWPYLWQQTEYVMGGGSTRFLFLVLAARDLALRQP